jgi:hypothetical protein
VNLACPACGAPFSADDVHLEVGIANCRVCRGVLDLRARDRPIAMPRPDRFSLDEADGALSIGWRWFRFGKLALIPFAVAWWAFLIFWYRGAMGRADLFALIFPIGHVAAGVAVVYMALANLLNGTLLRVDGEAVTVHHGPLPWRGNRRMLRQHIDQIYCRRDEHKNGISFAVVAIDVNTRRVDLVRGLPRADEARWLERTLEKALDLRDRPVEGELSRG